MSDSNKISFPDCVKTFFTQGLKVDHRVKFRRKTDRRFWVSLVRALIILNLLFLFGFGVEMVHMRVEHNTTEREVRELIDNQLKGARNTAGNAWQQAQVTLYGKVDMSLFPAELRDPTGTWFDTWLRDNDLMIGGQDD